MELTDADRRPASEELPASAATTPVWPIYLASALLATVVWGLYQRVWSLTWTVPFDPAAGSQVAIIDQTLAEGWYSGADPSVISSVETWVAGFDHPLHLLEVGFFGLFTSNAALIANLIFFLGFPAAAVTATAFLRKVGLSPWPTVALATLFALTPFHFLQGQAALPIAGYWVVPLGLCVVLAVLRREKLWTVPATGSAVEAVLTGPAARTTAALLLVALSGPDFGAFVAVLLAFAAVAGCLRERQPWRPRLLQLGAAAAALLVLFALRWLWNLTAGQPTTDQPIGDISANSFKLFALFLPATGHPVGPLADLRARYDADFWYGSGDAALGAVAAAGFLVLLLVPLVRAVGERRRWTPLLSSTGRVTFAELSGLAWIAMLFGTFGGAAVLDLIGWAVTGQVHVWNRISIVLVLLGLAAVGLGLDALGARWGRGVNAARLPMIAAVVVFLVGAYDQKILATSPDQSSVVVQEQS